MVEATDAEVAHLPFTGRRNLPFYAGGAFSFERHVRFPIVQLSPRLFVFQDSMS